MNPRLSVLSFILGQEETEIKPIIGALEYASFLPSIRLPACPSFNYVIQYLFHHFVMKRFATEQPLWHRLWQRLTEFGL